MKKSLKRAWTDELRSGRKNQGVGCLCRDDTEEFCCLGVLCDVLKTPYIVADAAGEPRVYVYGLDSRTGYLPLSLAAEIGLHDIYQRPLSIMNDDGRSFSDIADWIDLHIPEEDD